MVIFINQDSPFHYDHHSLVVLYHSSYENMNFYSKFTCKFYLRDSKFTGLSIFSFDITTLALMRSCVRTNELCARTMTMEDAYQVKITLQSRAPNVDSNSFSSDYTAHAACRDTHRNYDENWDA